ncbi:MAG TPA: SRPBCC family protein [Gaiellaceae bacterium]|nr:SRPBCC family protein [Gaiellaceae bacterium]
MPSYTETKELLAPLEDVWLFLAEPRHLADWWPGVAAVTPDSRGLAPAARWQLHATMRPGLLRRPASDSMLQIIDVEPPTRISWYMNSERLDVELRLSDAGSHHTRAELTVSGPFLVGLRRSLPRNALRRLFALCQTAAED